MSQQPMFLLVYVPEFPVQARLRLRPQLRRAPVAVLHGMAPLERVTSTNAAARQMGVEPGMTRAQLEVFRGLHMLDSSPAEERAARGALLQAAAEFTPRMEAAPAGGAEFALVLDVAGTGLLWGSLDALLERVRRRMQALCVHARLVACSNAPAALCLARVPRKQPLRVPPGREAEALAQLPMSVLQLDLPTLETLTLWGIRTLGELAALPRTQLAVRLGAEGARLHALASGTEPHLLVAHEDSPSLEECVEFDAPVEQLDSLLFMLRRMLQQVVQRAEARAYGLASVTVRLQLDGGGYYRGTVRPALPTTDSTALLKLLQLHLQQHSPGAGIVAVTLLAEAGKRPTVQEGLFSPQLPESLRLDVTLARIAAMVGEGEVGRARLLDTHCDSGFAMEPFTIDTGTSTAAGRQPCGAAMTMRRCRPAVPVRVQAASGASARPCAFRLRGVLYRVGQCFGPWQGSGSWWSAEAWSHEDWDVSAESPGAESGTLLALLRHNLLQDVWTLEGLYD